MIRGEVSGVESLRESPQTSAPEWNPKAGSSESKLSSHPLFFQIQKLKPKVQVGPAGCCDSCRLGAFYRENDHSKHKHMCGSDRSSSVAEAQTKHLQQG